jgi:UPF0755 protein
MQEEGIVHCGWLLKALFRYHGTGGKIKAGEYAFDRPMTPEQVYEKLLKGEFVYRTITVVEGADQFDVQTALVNGRIGTPAEFETAVHSPETLAALRQIDPSLDSTEGFLFPETYFVAKWDSTQEAILMMLREFGKRYGENERHRARELGLSTLQVVTLASLIEKEAANEAERPLIAGVFQNRLRLKMLLQCDPTVIYAMKLAGIYNGRILTEDLHRPSPYNTYVNPGLPPSPICNPGQASLQAALYPSQTDKLYFVLKEDGAHYFSATLQEHNRAVAQYRRNHRR